MAVSEFYIEEHVIPCQHIRGFSYASKDLTAVLQLAVKQYTPKDVSTETTPAVTVIALHANGITKIWEELAIRLDNKIKSIWIADSSHEGASGILNEKPLGDGLNWFDHSKDLLGTMIDFRDVIQPPIIGITHSMGCAQLVKLAQIHPALFQRPKAAFMTSYRPDFWNSREEAQTFFDKNKFYESWDRRSLNKYLQYGLHLQRYFSMLQRLLASDYDVTQAKYLFHRAEPGLVFQALPTLQPAVYWIFAKHSYINPPKERDVKISQTGAKARGSGGVSSAIVKGVSHLLPLGKVDETPTLLVSHIEQQMERYKKERNFWDTLDTGKSDNDKQVLSSQ
ncbi:hypothetical protein K505DRAFT_354062 [Melanomma pulvis-pyrius CBS 109.77]|uniref:AB hydrolase-1 domain-containing protein n=1 Tax=Melanomma pulvis-pyrius CBS 109.77 TaxID=1314802 RepID=A0A6A6WT51_9PLEO|nr:hypothetical protein K505DRAFT_354062 [Melanomma pulvis-pyrius CBS 109.77]